MLGSTRSMGTSSALIHYVRSTGSGSYTRSLDRPGLLVADQPNCLQLVVLDSLSLQLGADFWPGILQLGRI